MNNTYNSSVNKYKIYGGIILGFIFVLAVVSICMIVRGSQKSSDSYVSGTVAEIYQNGELYQTLNLDSCGDMSFTIYGDDGCFNTIQVQDGYIGITSASCPDKLCVHQGYINTSLLPITCLPNRVVIVVNGSEDAGTDILTY
jgi:hypothetical protein